MRIPKWAIEKAKREGACEEAWKWLEATSRTFRELARRETRWAEWAVDLFFPPRSRDRVFKLIEDADERYPLTPAGDACYDREHRKLLVEALEKYFKGRKPRK